MKTLGEKYANVSEDSEFELFENYYGAIANLIELFFTMVNCALVKATTIWPSIVSDRETFEKLLTLVITRIVKLQLYLYEFRLRVIPIGPYNPNAISDVTGKNMFDDIFDGMIDERLGIIRKLLSNGINTFNSLGIIKEFDSVIDSIWKISNNFHDDRDWRDLLNLDWILKMTNSDFYEKDEYGNKYYAFGLYPYFNINKEKRKEHAENFQSYRRYVLGLSINESLTPEQESSDLETDTNKHITEKEVNDHEGKSKITEQPEIPCIFCQYKDQSEFGLSIHYAENHEKELMELRIEGDKDKKIDFAILKGKMSLNIKDVLP